MPTSRNDTFSEKPVTYCPLPLGAVRKACRRGSTGKSAAVRATTTRAGTQTAARKSRTETALAALCGAKLRPGDLAVECISMATRFAMIARALRMNAGR